MSDTTDIPHDDDAQTAAEYVLGVLPPDEAQRFARRLMRDAALRDLCDAWTEHFVDVTDGIDGVRPPDAVWRGIEARVFGRRAPLWRRLGIAQAVLGGALAAGLAFAALRFGWLEPEVAPLTAQIASDSEGEVARARYDPASGRLSVELVALFPEPGRARELWLIEGTNAPVSLGLLDPGAVVALDLPQEWRSVIDGAVLAISDEPEGGSPTGAPTGAVLATGAITTS